MSNCGKQAYIGTSQGNVYIIDNDSHDILNTFKLHTSDVLTITESTSKTILVSGGSDGKVSILDMKNQKERYIQISAPVINVLISHCNNFIIILAISGKAYVFKNYNF